MTESVAVVAPIVCECSVCGDELTLETAAPIGEALFCLECGAVVAVRTLGPHELTNELERQQSIEVVSRWLETRRRS
jgi:hypothetical protein